MSTDTERQIARLADQITQSDAAHKLSRLGEPAVAPLLAALDTEDQVMQGGIVTALRGIGEAAVPQLIEALGHASQYVQGNSANTLRALGAKAAPALVEALTSDNTVLAANAAATLRRMPREAIDVLKQKLDAGEDQVTTRVRAMYIEMANVSDAELEAFLAENLGSSDPLTASAAVNAAASKGSGAVPALLSLMREEDAYKQQNGTNAMIEIGADAVAALVEALGDEGSARLQQNAVRALSAITQREPEAALGRLIEALGNEDSQLLQQNAMYALAGAGEAATAALREASGSENQFRAQNAQRALNTMRG